MKVRLHSNNLEELFIEKTYPDRFSSHQNGGVTERNYSAELLDGQGGYREIFMENIHIGHGNMKMNTRAELDFESDMETVEMHFALQGKTRAEDRDHNHTYLFDYNQHNIIYANRLNGRAFYPSGKNIELFEINLFPDFFKRFLPEEEKAFFRFLKAINRQENSVLSSHHYPITPAMHWLIQEILNCNRKGLYKRFFLEAKVTELLLLQLEQISSAQEPTKHQLKKSDIERMHAVKDYLGRHLNEPCTLLELAHLFGTNEYSLKKGFKEVFGTTVFSYWSAVKMNRAKHMLLEEKMTVREVADRIGYKNPQHFTTAFKKRFGHPPSHIR
ncbi:MAG: AraC family transcriptional regulator [Bacteroidota bacterium]